MENKSNQSNKLPYQRPLRLRPRYINTLSLYHDLFNLYYNSHQKLTFQKLSNGYQVKDGEYFMKTLLKFTGTNGNNNSNFVNELKGIIDSGFHAIGFAVTLQKENTYHMIGGIIFPLEKKLELYDPNAVAKYPIQGSNPESVNNLYDHTFRFFDTILNEKHHYFAHVERAFVPGTCGISEKGICALWSLIYIIMRMSKLSVEATHSRIFKIANSNNSKQFMIKLMKNIQKLKYNQSPNGVKSILNLIQLENV